MYKEQLLGPSYHQNHDDETTNVLSALGYHEDVYDQDSADNLFDELVLDGPMWRASTQLDLDSNANEQRDQAQQDKIGLILGILFICYV